jgi:hypothetical protein
MMTKPVIVWILPMACGHLNDRSRPEPTMTTPDFYCFCRTGTVLPLLKELNTPAQICGEVFANGADKFGINRTGEMAHSAFKVLLLMEKTHHCYTTFRRIMPG